MVCAPPPCKSGDNPRYDQDEVFVAKILGQVEDIIERKEVMIQMETIEKIRALMKLMPQVSSMPECKKLVESGDAEVILRNPMLKDTLEYYRRTEKRYQYLMGRLEDMLRKNEVSLEHVRELLEDVTCFD